ncbi:MAG: hypothetical protein JSS28_02020 [Proteobacteria bacterium]|nr:hypothetical protein [Pseudomonadota bacterium]
MRGGDAQWLCAELARFVFRAKVRLRVVDDSRLTGSASADEVGAIAGAIPHDYACTPPGPVHALSLADDPSRWLLFGASHAPTANADARERWRLADIRAGLPEIGDELRDQMLPQWIGLDRLGAVNVRKGCYPGQEIMARLHFKGGNKRSLYGLWFPGESTPIAGTVVRNAGGNEAGTIVVAARDPGTNGVEALASMVDSTTAGKLQVEGQASVEITCQFG